MPIQVSYKKQFVFLFLLTLTFLIVVEVLVNIWLYYFYRCDFEDNEIFKDMDEESKKKFCLESLGHGFVKQSVSWEKGTRVAEVTGGIDESIVHFNSEGFRGPEFTKIKQENSFRIFAIGGSTTFGSGVFDNQTWPYYLQQMYEQTNLGPKVEVINIGFASWWSKPETEQIKNKFIEYEPNLFIVYDGWNDVGREAYGKNPKTSSLMWKERWLEICELGEQHNFDTLIAIQPLVGAGNKVLTEQEYTNSLKKRYRDLELPLYPSYIEQLNELKNHCSLTADLRHIFDHVYEPIYYDNGHVGPTGNKIIAENLYQLSLPLVVRGIEDIRFTENLDTFPIEDINSQLISNDIDVFLDKSYLTLREIISYYQTPRVSSLIF